jgi:uncharacterized ParB-like nuclease family protein
MVQRITVPLSSLYSPYENLSYNKRTKTNFLEFVSAIKAGTAYIEPITICSLKATEGRKYYIQDGVHRAMASLLAGKTSIIANLYSDSPATGSHINLSNVRV